jgi:small-conductance mechanosensitive channel
MARLQGLRFWVLGSIYWMVVAVLVGTAHYFWPHIADTAPFFFAAVLGAVIAGFAIVYLFRPK